VLRPVLDLALARGAADHRRTTTEEA
jgi:hypothetical protein